MSNLYIAVFFALLSAMFYGCFSQNALVVFVAVVGMIGMLIGDKDAKHAD